MRRLGGYPSGGVVSEVYLKKYGAIGDGVADDTTAINNALLQGGKVIAEKGKTYLVTTLLASIPNTVIDFSGATIKRKVSTISHILKVTANNVIVNGGTFVGNNSGGQAGEVYNHSCVYLENSNYSTVRNITATDLYGIGIKLYNTNHCTIENNSIIQPKIQGIYAEPATGVSNVGLKILNNKIEADASDVSTGIYVASIYTNNSWTNDYVINGNYVKGSLTAGITSNAVLITGRGKRGIINNNTTIGGRMGISNDWNEDGVNFGNIIKDFTQYGIESVGHASGSCSNMSISGNNIKTTDLQAYGYIASGENINNIKIFGNTIEGGKRNLYINANSATLAEGIDISGNSLINGDDENIYFTRVENLKVSGNLIQNNSTGNYGIFLSNTQKAIIVNNIFKGTFLRSMSFYNGTGASIVDVLISENMLGSALAASLEGTAVFGSNVKIHNNIGTFGNENYEDYNLKRYIGTTTSFNDPEGNVTAGIGSVVRVINPGRVNLWLKTSGTGNTGWVKMAYILSGATASRPTSELRIGQSYFDTTLGYNINWNGTVWVNGSGTTV